MMKINAHFYAKLIAALIPGELNCQELAEETGLHYVTVLEYTRELHKAKACHIVRWDKDTRDRDAIKVYKLGPGRDARRKRLTANERQQRLRERKVAAQEAAVLSGRGRFVQSANGRRRFEELSRA